MKTVSANLLAHLQGVALTVSTLWKVTRTDAQVFGFTDNSSDLSYLGTTYLASTGHTPSNIHSTLDLSVDNLEIVSVLDSTLITDSDIAAGLWDNALVEVMVVNYNSLADGHMTLRTGTIGDIKTGRTHFTAELRGMMQPLQQTIGRTYKAGCDALLGDSRCAKALGAFTFSGTVTGVTSNRIFVSSALVNPTGYFSSGTLTWTSGANTGLTAEVKTSVLGSGNTITLYLQMPRPIAIGDTYSIIAGCDKTYSTCYTKFGNITNFRGFPHIPGADVLVSGQS